MSKMVGFVGLGILGLLLAVGGALLLDMFPKILENKIKQELRLINGTDAFERWRKTPVPITMKFYIFELNNSDSYTNLDDIQLTERGPYVFDETRTKEQIVFYSRYKNESLVSYRERRQFTFREDLSVGLYDDNITFINLPLLGIIYNEILADGKLGFDLYKDILDPNEKSLFTTRTVGQLLFDGIDLKLHKELEPFVPRKSGIKMKPFSLYDGRDILEEEMSVFTGIDSMQKFGQIARFDKKSNDNKKKTLIWPYHKDQDQLCNEFRGTDATFFEPNLKPDHLIYAFEPQICRSMFFKYEKPSEVRGIRTLRYYTPKESFESPLKYKPNSCYCLKKNVTDCDSNGILEISHCLRVSKGAPVVVSAPYFLSGDPNLRDDINLVAPKPLDFENYGTFIDVEPMTGIVLRAFKRLQISIRISHSDATPQLNATVKDKDYIIPVLWLEETAEVDEKQADLLKIMVFNKQKLITGASIASVVMGASLVMIASFLIAKNSKRL